LKKGRPHEAVPKGRDLFPFPSGRGQVVIGFFEGVAAGFENMLNNLMASLSGIGESLRNIFRGFSIC